VPYRLFTSRAEYCLQLRIDNADTQLTEHGHRLGLISDVHHQEFLNKQERIRRVRERLQSTPFPGEGIGNITCYEWLRKPHTSFRELKDSLALSFEPTEEEIRHIESEIKYEGYLKKQAKEIARMRKTERVRIPLDLEFAKIPGLTREAVEKLSRVRPDTLGEAKRIPGLTPAALSNIQIHLKLLSRGKITKKA